MKASELISQLQQVIEENGDMEIKADVEIYLWSDVERVTKGIKGKVRVENGCAVIRVDYMK